MMKLSVMLKVDSAIDEEGRSPIAERILERWGHEPGSARFYRSSANFVYTFSRGGEQGGGRCFLRFADSGERSAAEVAAELALLRWVASQDMRVAAPIASTHGREMETVATDLGTFHAVVFPALPGAQMEIEELSAEQFERWGAALGQLHATMRRCPTSAVAARRTWRDQFALVRGVMPADEPRVQAECERLSAWLAALPQTEATYGLTHGDFELDNLFWQDDGQNIAMLDFDDCACSWYAADIALALRDLFKEAGVELDNPSLRAFIGGYAQRFPIAEEAVAQLPTWLRLANLVMYGKLLRALDLPAGGEYPAWVAEVQAHLQRWMDNYTASLAAVAG